MLARAVTRRSELSLRMALCAARTRLVQQMLTESMLLSLAGGALGILLAVFGCKGLAALAPEYLLQSAPGLARGALDLRVLAVALTTVIGTTFMFGLAPALQVSKPNLNEVLKEGGKGTSGGGRSKLRSLLVISEVALALVLLVGAGLMINSFFRLRNAFNRVRSNLPIQRSEMSWIGTGFRK